MKKSIIVIFIVILAAHLAALMFFLASGPSGQEEKKSPNLEEPPELVPESVPEPSIISSGDSLKGPKKGTSKPSAKPKRRLAPYSFKGAVVGKIPKLPFSGKAGILVDVDSGKVLWAFNAKKPVPIASMTKMMTGLLAFEDIHSGKASPNAMVKISRKAASIKTGCVWLDPREKMSLGNLIKAMMIKSANDAAYQVAEFLGGGNVAVFVKRMNAKAAEMGLKKTKFFNPNGLPGKTASLDNVASCEDMAMLADALSRIPEAVKLSSTRMTFIPRTVGKYKKTQLVNTNNLVRRRCPGVYGMKTGYTRRAGSCIAIACRRKGRDLIAVVAGFKHASDRDLFVKKLLDWGYKR